MGGSVLLPEDGAGEGVGGGEGQGGEALSLSDRVGAAWVGRGKSCLLFFCAAVVTSAFPFPSVELRTFH